MTEETREDTLDFILSYTRGAPEQLFSVADALDSKVVQIFAAASVVMGLAGVSEASVHGSKAALSFLWIALIAYSCTSLCAFVSMNLRRFRESLQANVLWRDYHDKDVSEIKHAIVDDIRTSFGENREIVDGKAEWAQRGLAAATIEVLAVVLMVISSRLV
jgi:hypothetical protein